LQLLFGVVSDLFPSVLWVKMYAFTVRIIEELHERELYVIVYNCVTLTCGWTLWLKWSMTGNMYLYFQNTLFVILYISLTFTSIYCRYKHILVACTHTTQSEIIFCSTSLIILILKRVQKYS